MHWDLIGEFMQGILTLFCVFSLVAWIEERESGDEGRAAD